MIMSKPTRFELNVHIEFQDYWRATYSYMFLILKFKQLLIAAVGCLLIFLFLAVRYPYGKPAYELLIPLAGLAVLLIILYLNTKYLFSAKKFLHANVRYVFSDTGVDAIAPLAPGWRSWNEIAKAIELKHDFVVFYSPERMYPIPKRCLQDAAALHHFRELLERHLGSRAKLR